MIGFRIFCDRTIPAKCRSLTNQNVDIWDSILQISNNPSGPDLKQLNCLTEESSVPIQEATLTENSEKISFVVAGYVAKKLKTKIECDSFTELLTGRYENCVIFPLAVKK